MWGVQGCSLTWGFRQSKISERSSQVRLEGLIRVVWDFQQAEHITRSGFVVVVPRGFSVEVRIYAARFAFLHGYQLLSIELKNSPGSCMGTLFVYHDEIPLLTAMVQLEKALQLRILTVANGAFMYVIV